MGNTSSVVLKFPLLVVDETQIIDMPLGAKIVHVDNQNGLPVMWAVVPAAYNERQRRAFAVHGTGQPIPPSEYYLGTAICGRFVWHVFEVKP